MDGSDPLEKRLVEEIMLEAMVDILFDHASYKFVYDYNQQMVGKPNYTPPTKRNYNHSSLTPINEKVSPLITSSGAINYDDINMKHDMKNILEKEEIDPTTSTNNLIIDQNDICVNNTNDADVSNEIHYTHNDHINELCSEIFDSILIENSQTTDQTKRLNGSVTEKSKVETLSSEEDDEDVDKSSEDITLQINSNNKNRCIAIHQKDRTSVMVRSISTPWPPTNTTGDVVLREDDMIELTKFRSLDIPELTTEIIPTTCTFVSTTTTNDDTIFDSPNNNNNNNSDYGTLTSNSSPKCSEHVTLNIEQSVVRNSMSPNARIIILSTSDEGSSLVSDKSDKNIIPLKNNWTTDNGRVITSYDEICEECPGLERFEEQIHSTTSNNENKIEISCSPNYPNEAFGHGVVEEIITPVSKFQDEAVTRHNEDNEKILTDHSDSLQETTPENQKENLVLAHDLLAERILPEGGLIVSNGEVIPDVSSHTVIPFDDPLVISKQKQYEEPNIRIVILKKTSKNPLGATIRNDGESVVIARVVKGGAAEASGVLNPGDEILEVNNESIRGRDINDVCQLLAEMTGPLTFVINPIHPDSSVNMNEVNDEMNHPPQQEEFIIHVRAHFKYEPEFDDFNPCPELAVPFEKGDILHIISKEDSQWWQAYRDGEEEHKLAGLIPSKSFEEARRAMNPTTVISDNDGQKKKRMLCARRKKSRKHQKLYNDIDDDGEDDIHTYEEVGLYYPQPNRKRPIVLIGPAHVGRHELRQRLLQSSDRFGSAIPHTSRLRRADEQDGHNYYFVPRSQFEADINANKFAEYGEYDKNLYGTSLHSIREVVNKCQICVLNLHPQALRVLKASDLKPYVVFVAPPNFEKLKSLHLAMNTQLTDDDLRETIQKAREMEETFGHYFDMVIVNSDMQLAYDELLAEVNRLEREPQWVPISWLNQ